MSDDDAARNRQLVHAIAVNLRRIRTSFGGLPDGLSQNALADRANVHRNTIATYELELVEEPKHATLKKLADALGVDVSALTAPVDVEPNAARQSLERFLASEYSDATPAEAAQLRSKGWPWGDPGVKGWMKLLEVMRGSAK